MFVVIIHVYSGCVSFCDNLYTHDSSYHCILFLLYVLFMEFNLVPYHLQGYISFKVLKVLWVDSLSSSSKAIIWVSV